MFHGQGGRCDMLKSTVKYMCVAMIVLMGSGTGIFGENVWDIIFEGEYIHSLKVDRQGRVWVFKSDGLYWLDGDQWKNTGIPDDVYGIMEIEHDPAGYAIIVAESDIVRLENGQWVSIINERQSIPAAFSCLEFDKYGNSWIGTHEHGLYVFNPDGEELRHFSREDGLASDSVGSLAIDVNGEVWVGAGMFNADGTGIARYDGAQWVRYDWNNGFANSLVTTISISPVNGDVWCGTPLGLFSFDGHSWSKYTQKDGLVDDRVNDIEIDTDGNIWIAAGAYTSIWSNEIAEGGVSCFDGTEWVIYTSENGLVFDFVLNITAVSPNDVFFATGKGISRLIRIPDVNVCETESDSQILSIIGNFPNPFNDSTDIRFATETSDMLELAVFTIHGQKIRVLLNDRIDSSLHTIRWDGKDTRGNRVSSGIYILRLNSKVMSKTHTMGYIR